MAVLFASMNNSKVELYDRNMIYLNLHINAYRMISDGKCYDNIHLSSFLLNAHIIVALNLERTVGPGGSPDENGETTIDALVMNGVTILLIFLSSTLLFLLLLESLHTLEMTIHHTFCQGPA